MIWDVGHQTYGHKILTGRRDSFPTIRSFNGISGFPNRSESIYDTFGVGHASTSISAALGMAVASRLNGDERKVVAIIGDGASTAGLAFEGLNNAGTLKDTNLLIILNDNGMSISPNDTALEHYFASKEIFSDPLKASDYFYNTFGIRYFGPIDGNDLPSLLQTLKAVQNLPGPKLLHCKTVKGKGYAFAEHGNPAHWHAPGIFDPKTGETIAKANTNSKILKFQQVFGRTMVELAEKNEKIFAITPAMLNGSGLESFQAQFPERTFDVGIAEQHAATFAAGLATQGLTPFCCLYSTFLQRAYDQVIHDVAVQDLPVVFCIDRAGLVGHDGVTHQGVFDLASLRILPHFIVAAPMNESEFRNLLYTAQLSPKHPFGIRYPRGKGFQENWQTPFEEIPIGKGRKLNDGEDIALLTIGTVGNYAQEAVQQLKNDDIFVAHYDLRFVKPLDETLLQEVFSNYKHIITIEDGCVLGGFGSAVLEWSNAHHFMQPIKMLGIPDQFIQHGTQDELRHLCGFDTDGIVQAVKAILKK